MKVSYLDHSEVFFVDFVHFLDKLIEVFELLVSGSENRALRDFHLG